MSTSISLPSTSNNGDKLLQHLSLISTTQVIQSITENTQTPITGFELAITPTRADSRILISVNMNIGCPLDNFAISGNCLFGLMRDSTPIGNAVNKNYFAHAVTSMFNDGQDNAGNTIGNTSYNYEELSNNTSLRIYRPTVFVSVGGGIRLNTNLDFSSSIIIQEIAS